MLEEIIALIVDEDEGGEILDFNLPDSLHTEFGILEEFYLLDRILSEDGSGATDRTEVETAMLKASVSDLLRAVALSYHNHSTTCGLELIDVWVHTTGSRRAERTGGEAFRFLGGACVIDGVIFEILRHRLSGVEAFLDLGVSDITAHDDGAIEREASRYGVLIEESEDLGHGAIEVDLNDFTLAGIAELLGDKFTGELIEFFDPDTVAVDLRLDITVGRAADAHTYGARSAMTRHTDHTDIVGEILTAELSSESYIVGGVEEFLLEFDISESVAILIALSGEIVVILHRSLLDSGEVGFGRSTADDESDMIGRTSGSAESLHLLDKERHESLLIKDSLSLLIEISLIGRAATLSHEEELILIALGGMDFDLRREVATGVHLIIHIEGSVLRIAEIILSISLIYTLRDHLLIVATGPYLLTLISGTD